MRITIPVSGDGERWMIHFPDFDLDPNKVLDKDGKLIVPAVLDFIKMANKQQEEDFGRQMFMMSSGDQFNALSMTVEFMRQLTAVVHWLEDNPKANAHVASDGFVSDRRLIRHLRADKVAFVRIDVRGLSNSVKFLIGYGNPKGVVIGNAERGAHEFALLVARVLFHLAERINALPKDRTLGFTIVIEGRDPNLLADAAKRDADAHEEDLNEAANVKRMTCQNRRGDYCAPICPSCRCYRNGRCVKATLEVKS